MFVSQNIIRPIFIKKIVPLFSLLILSSCAYYSPIYWGWGEWSGPGVLEMEEQSVTIFDWSRLPGIITSIDGIKAGSGYKKAKLSPGNHKIEYAYYPANFGMHPSGLIEMELRADHSYEFRIKLCYSCNPRRYRIWIHDRTTGKKVWEMIRPDKPE